jgi:hypothetical protein
MSANVSTNNLAVSGTCGISGTVSLSSNLISGSTASYQGITTTDLTTTGSVTHNVLPICNVLPVVSGEITNKGYVDTINSIQDTRIVSQEVKTTNLSFNANRTTLLGVSTVGGIMTHTVPPVCSTLPTSASQLSNKQYVDNNFTIVSNSISVTNTAATALTTRVTNVEGVNTAQASSITEIQGVNTGQATSITALEIRATAIENVNTNQNTNITALQTENGTQNSQILTLQEKTSAIVYSNPPAGQLTEISSSVSILPYNNSTFLKSFSLSCNNIICSIQATFGGSGSNQGVTTSQLQVGGFGIPYKTFYYGSSTSVNGTNTVTFATAMTGTFPKILLTAIGTSSVVLSNKTLAGFNYTATGVFNVDWIAIQPL